MVLSKRERYIAVALGAALGVLALDHFVINPYTSFYEQLAKDKQKVGEDQHANHVLFDQHRDLQKVWNAMLTGGLKRTRAEAEQQMIDTVVEWAQESGVGRLSWKPERTVTDKGFEQISYHATGTGPMAAVARLLWRLETAPIPLRVQDVNLSSHTEGTDDLQLSMSISTISMIPGAEREQDRGRAVADARGTQP